MTDLELDSLRRRLVEAVDERAERLLEVSHAIWERPELNFEEHFAHGLLTAELEAAGFDVERNAYELATAFDARWGDRGPIVALCCEYDALPGIGHACGHNIIAGAGLGAALAAATVADEVGGRLRVLGTPAEEGGGGKVFMIRGGAFDEVTAALMVHPADRDLTEMTTIAIQRLEVTYQGRSAHAAAAPHLGRNALDAAVLGYVNVAALRQHIRPEERVHGVFTEAGDKANIVPERAAAEWYVRARDLESLEPLKERVLAALEAGAAASGCAMTHVWGDPAYSDLRVSDPLLAAYAANAERLGRPIEAPDEATSVVGSTDMGNVSHVVPSIHPMIRAAPAGVAIHTPDFTDAARSDLGDAAVLDGAKALALTVLDVWTDPALAAALTTGPDDAGAGS